MFPFPFYSVVDRTVLTISSYNSQAQPLPFMKASSVIAPKKQAKEKPDLEEALDESDEGEVVEEVKDENEEMDITKDKYVKVPKKKAAKKAKAKAKKAESGDEEGEEKPKKGKGKAAAGAKGKGKGKGKK